MVLGRQINGRCFNAPPDTQTQTCKTKNRNRTRTMPLEADGYFQTSEKKLKHTTHILPYKKLAILGMGAGNPTSSSSRHTTYHTNSTYDGKSTRSPLRQEVTKITHLGIPHKLCYNNRVGINTFHAYNSSSNNK
ncbi:uncharacterized protein LOC128922295 [Zeugodacus cucurbitae]|uniref:uncharacterized protein LOC128922295 n=1 Tax=Zeugodacus cucurbitae TaxID=28588 RepID=UPI0023D941B2|nr:uncharacterized protein LOC128922295 [Zeugodacus cucurbitae]